MDRRTVLASVGSFLTLGAVVGVGTASRIFHQQSDGSLFPQEHSGTLWVKDVEFELDPGTWGHRKYTINADREIALRASVETGHVAVAMMDEPTFRSDYRSILGSEIEHSFTVDERSSYQDSRAEVQKGETWVLVVDNTDYFEDQSPDGRAIGGASISEVSE